MSGNTGVEDHRLAVGVLELVDVRSAGVVFTMDPVSGDREENDPVLAAALRQPVEPGLEAALPS